MDERQRELKRKYLSEQRSSLTDPLIDCLECEHGKKNFREPCETCNRIWCD